MTTTFRSVLSGIAITAGLVVLAAPVATAAPASPEAAGSATVTDDTGALTLGIPQGWVATTAPDRYWGIDDQFPGQLLPTIVASPTGEQYDETGFQTVPSLAVQAFPTPDGASLGEFYGDYGVDCTTFTDGEFAANGLSGTWGTTSGCAWSPGQTRASLWASFDDGSGSVFVDYYSTTGADATWDALINSIRRSGPISTTPAPELVGMIFPYTTFGEVPRLGTEPVRGTGCGADGTIGDVIPDGIWAGFVDAPAPGAPLSVDLLCVFTPEAAPGVIAAGTATFELPNGSTEPDPSYLIVNNNERERTVPTAPTIELRDAIFDGSGCVEGPFLDEVDHSEYQAWINIAGGQATWVIWGCDFFGDGDGVSDGPPPAPAPTAPPTIAPAPPADPEEALLQADCALLQTTIWEGDQFLDVEFPADGEPFTDSLRQTIEFTRDFFGYEASQVQSQLAINAFAQYYAEWDSLLQAGIYTSTNMAAVTEAGLFALAPLQNACGWAQ